MSQLDLDFRDLPEKMAPGSIVSVHRDLDRNGKYYNIAPEDKDILRKGTNCIYRKIWKDFKYISC
mgnify:CR=1 FL=1